MLVVRQLLRVRRCPVYAGGPPLIVQCFPHAPHVLPSWAPQPPTFSCLIWSAVCSACRYWEEKGFVVMLTARVLNLAALAFTREPGCLPACLPARPPACLPACLICRRSCFCCAPRCICLAICAATRAAAAASHAQQTELFTRLPACLPRPALPPCSGHVGSTSAVRQLGGPAGRVPEEGHMRHLGGEGGWPAGWLE